MKSKKYFVAIDIGGTKTNIAFFNHDKIKKIINFPTLKYGPNNIIKIISILNEFKNNISKIGYSLTGKIENGFWTPMNFKTLGNFKNYPIIKTTKRSLKIPVFALGDTQSASIGELAYGGGKNLDSFFYITISTGVGGSLIYKKKLFDNKITSIGAIGHSVIKYNGIKCGCGNNGCLEAYVSGNAIIKQSKVKNCKSTKDLLTKYYKNKNTIKIVDTSVNYLSQSLININKIIGIENFIIGGSVGLNNFFYNKLKNNKLVKSNKISITKAKLKSKAELFGCLAYSKL